MNVQLNPSSMSLNPATHTATAPAIHASPVNSASRPADELKQQGRRVQELVEQIDAMPDPATRALMQDCLQSVLELHGQGLAQILHVVQDAGSDGQKVFDQLIHDSVVRGLLLIHGLHPVSLEARLHEALNKVRPYMKSHGGNVELISLENDMARLRLQGTCKSCPSSAVTMELAVRQAIEEACPDLMGFAVEGAGDQAAPGEVIRNGKLPPTPAWIVLDGIGQLDNWDVKTIEAGGVPLIICRVNEIFYVYRNVCPACGLSFKTGGFEKGLLRCSSGHRYEVQRAGHGLDNPDLHLDPFPLLVENGQVKVSVR
ncbi:MAG: Nitrogen-fixing NifU domain protein [Pedosphaera sp.]|nr:Nitrogen-fixing NifU domain protein [Pedosphaera sp.]